MEFLDSMKIGHPDIDRDHERIVEIINEISDALDDGDREGCSQLFDIFIGATQQHFVREEGILRECNFPRIDQHIAYHRELIDRALDVKEKCHDVVDVKLMRQCFDDFTVFVIDDIVRGDLDFKSYLMISTQG